MFCSVAGSREVKELVSFKMRAFSAQTEHTNAYTNTYRHMHMNMQHICICVHAKSCFCAFLSFFYMSVGNHTANMRGLRITVQTGIESSVGAKSNI